MPDTPTGSYIGSYGLPVATGETKIGLSAWDADLVQGSYLSVESLDSDNLTLAAPLLEDTDYASCRFWRRWSILPKVAHLTLFCRTA